MSNSTTSTKSTTSTFLHKDGECEVLYSGDNDYPTFSINTHVHVKADSIGRGNHIVRTPEEAAVVISGDTIAVDLGQDVCLLLDDKTARKLARYLNAAARAVKAAEVAV